MKKLLLILFLSTICFGAWDATKPADSRVWNLAAGDIRDNWAAIVVGLGANFYDGDLDINSINGTDANAIGSIGVNVKSYGAIGDGVTDDTNAILQAIHSISPICTTYSSQTLAGFTAGEDFNTTNVYRGGGVVFFPRGIYKTTSTIYINSGVILMGEGHQGIYSTALTSTQGSTIYFNPTDANNLVAVAATSFVSTTGQRYDVTDFEVARATTNSRTYNCGVRDLTIWCKAKTLIGLKFHSAVKADVSNVSVRGTPITGICATDSIAVSYHNVSITSTTCGLLASWCSISDFSGYLYFDQTGTKETTCPNFSATYDDLNTYSLALGFYQCNNATLNSPIFESYERGCYAGYSGVTLIRPHFESLSKVACHTESTSLTVENASFSKGGNMLYCDNAKDTTYQQIRFTGNILHGGSTLARSYERFIDPNTPLTTNYKNGVIIDTSYYPFKSEDDSSYSFVTLVGDSERQFAKREIIDRIKYTIASDPNKVVALWIFDPTSGTSISDKGDNAHTLTSSVDVNTLTPTFIGLAPVIDQSVSLSTYLETIDHNDFTFVSGGADVAFSIIALVLFDNDVGKPFLAKSDSSTGAEKREWFFGIDDTNPYRLLFKLTDETNNGNIRATADANSYSDDGSVHCYIGTYDGSSNQSGILIYRDGSLVASTKAKNGTYTTMANTASLPGSYVTLTTNNTKYIAHHGYMVLCIIKEELTATEVKRIDNLLRGYAGVSF